MASFKIGRLVVGLLDESLRHGLHHASGFRNGKVNCVTIRTFTTTQRKCEENHTETSANKSNDKGSKTISDASYVSPQMFHQLDKDVGMLNLEVNTVQEAIKDLGADIKDLGKKLDSKFGCLIFLVVGGVVINAGFDLYVNERNWARTHNEK